MPTGPDDLTETLPTRIAAIDVVVHATGPDGNAVAGIPTIVIPLPEVLTLAGPDARASVLALTGTDPDGEIAALRDVLVASRDDVAAFDEALAALAGNDLVTWLALDGDTDVLREAALAATAPRVADALGHLQPAPGPGTGAASPSRGPSQREAAIDAVKRCFGVPKRVAATVVDQSRFDHVDLPDDTGPDEVEAVVTAAAAPTGPRAVATLVEAASRRRVLVGLEHGRLHLSGCDGQRLGVVAADDLSRLDGDTSAVTGMPAAGMATPMRTARKLLAVLAMAPRQHCDACGVLLTDATGPGVVELARPWCQGCMASTDVFACELCGRACSADDVHDNGSGYWCERCHVADGSDRDPDTVCRRHGNACVQAG